MASEETEGHIRNVTGTRARNTIGGSVSRTDDEQATRLARLEDEVSRLRSDWQRIEAEFKDRELLTRELSDPAQRPDESTAGPALEIERHNVRLRVVEQQLLDKESQVAALAADQEARAEEAVQSEAELAVVVKRCHELQQKFDAGRAEVEQLQAALTSEQAAAADVRKRNEQLSLEQQQLQDQVRELETCISGQQNHLLDMRAEIATYKNTLVGMDDTLEAKTAALAQRDQERQQLAAQIVTLERQAADLTAQRKEREVAYAELQRRLADHLQTAEELKVESATRAKENDRVLIELEKHRALSNVLKRGIERREERISALESVLESHKAIAAGLSTTRDELIERVDELERRVAERTEQLQVLRDHKNVLEKSLDERDEKLQRALLALEEETSVVAGLNQDLRGAIANNEELRRELESNKRRLTDLADQHSTAVREIEHELVTQQKLVARLETELREKLAIPVLTERDTGQTTDLGMACSALDRPGTEAETQTNHEMLPIKTAMASTGSRARVKVIDVGVPTDRQTSRLVARHASGHLVEYALHEGDMTIGRSKKNDIYISNDFVSRLHAKIQTRKSVTVIEDAGSRNGTSVNSMRVQRCVLHHGDIVRVGGAVDLVFIAPAARS
jgi:chromosome segregation ATPase